MSKVGNGGDGETTSPNGKSDSSFQHSLLQPTSMTEATRSLFTAYHLPQHNMD